MILKNSIKYMLLYFHTLLGRSIKPSDASYISTPLQFTQRCDKKILQPNFLINLLPVAILPLSFSYPLSVETPSEMLQYGNLQVKSLPTGKKLEEKGNFHKLHILFSHWHNHSSPLSKT